MDEERQRLLKQLRWLRKFKNREEKWYVYFRAIDRFLKSVEKYLMENI